MPRIMIKTIDDNRIKCPLDSGLLLSKYSMIQWITCCTYRPFYVFFNDEFFVANAVEFQNKKQEKRRKSLMTFILIDMYANGLRRSIILPYYFMSPNITKFFI